jgi:hypothetical protein
MTTITPEQRQLIERAGSEPVRLEDPETHQAYLLVKEEVYQNMVGLIGLNAGPLSIEEQKAVLAHVGKRAGWDDPALDVYNDLDPRRKP